MEVLQIQLFGPLAIHHAGVRLSCAATRKARAVLAYLALAQGRYVSRELVAGAFWGDLSDDKARRALNTDFWRLRQVLSKAGLEPAHYLGSGADGMCVCAQNATVDALEFSARLQDSTRCDPALANDENLVMLSDTLALYQGDFLEGSYDEWSLQQREHYRARYQFGLDYLLRAHLGREQWEQALQIGEQLIHIDPLQEHVHRALMSCFIALGDRPRAILQFRDCAEFLQDNLGIDPMPETLDLYRSLSSSDANPIYVPTSKRVDLRHLGEAVRHIDAARSSLERLDKFLRPTSVDD